MAGMFYSLKEVVTKLNKTEDQVRELVKQGMLREFRDGTNLLFKVNEVDTLVEKSKTVPVDNVTEPAVQAEEEEIFLAEEPQERTPPTPEKQPQKSEPDFTEELSLVEDTSSDALSILEEQEEKPPAEKTDFAKDIDLLRADTSIGSKGIEAAAEDTAAAKEAAGELGDLEGQYQVADDTGGETQASVEETELKKIEDDVNLDTFGSGSGLLDLSLQADDTSLGGILDEIYTEGKEEQGVPAAGSAMDMAAQTEQMLAETPLAAMEAPQAAAFYAEPEPDTSSNAFGIMLILPLLAVIYTAIIAIANFNKGVIPAILKPIQNLIWFIAAGLIVLSLIIIAVPFFLGGEPSAKKANGKPSISKKEKKIKEKKQKPEKEPA